MPRTLAALLALGALLAAASSAVRGTRLEVQEWDCPPAPAFCAPPVVVLGFPFPYVSDNQGISVVGSASLFGALIGEDFFHAGPFAADVAVYFAAAALVRRRPGEGATAPLTGSGGKVPSPPGEDGRKAGCRSPSAGEEPWCGARCWCAASGRRPGSAGGGGRSRAWRG